MAVAVGLLFQNMADVVTDLKTWHDGAGFRFIEPAFIGPLMKQFGMLLSGVASGSLIRRSNPRYKRKERNNGPSRPPRT